MNSQLTNDKPLSEMTLEELWRLFPIQLVEHSPDWPVWYEEERERLLSALGEHIARIDHIGSTFVGGLIAKPIVDILLQVKLDADLHIIKKVLTSDGWLLMAENSGSDEMSLNKGYTKNGFAEKVYHLHVRREGDWDELYFRDYLASHPEVAAAYAKLKQELLVQYEYNRDGYTEAKTEFVMSCTAKAREESQQSEEIAVKYLTRFDAIDTLNLSVRSYNALQGAGITTVGELVDFPQAELVDIKNMGAKSVAEIVAVLKEVRLMESDGSYVSDGEQVKFQFMHKPEKPKPWFMGADGIIYEDIPLADLGLSTRPYNRLKDAGIAFFSKLEVLSEAELVGLPSMGNKSLSEILNVKNNVTLHPLDDQFSVLDGIDEDTAAFAQRVVQNIVKTVPIHAGEIFDVLIALMKESPAANQPELELEPTVARDFFHTPCLHSALQEVVLRELEQAVYGLALAEIQEFIPISIRDEALVRGLVLEMEQAGLIICRSDSVYERKYQRLGDYIASFPKERERQVVEQRLQGDSLEEIGQIYGITRERVRQIVQSILKKAPKLFEERYALLFQKYRIEEADFLMGFRETKMTYHYLVNLHKQGKLPVSEIPNDDELPDEFKYAAERILYKNHVVINGEYVLCSRPELSDYVLRTAGTEGVTFEAFKQLYIKLLEDIQQQDDPKLSLMERGYENRLAASEHALWKYGKKLRYYNIPAYDFTYFFETLNLEQYRDVEYSTLKFFREYPDLMRDYDIEDEYELHNLLKKICHEEDFPDMHFRRMPNIEFGTADRDMQMQELLLSLAPVTNMALAEAYENEYGVSVRTVLANYLKNFDQYYHAGVYTIDAPALSEIMAARLRQLLTDDFYMLSDIRELYAKEFPNADKNLLNPFTLKTLGFRVYAHYVVSNKYESAVEYFRAILTESDLVDAKTFPKKLGSLISYTTELLRLKASRKIIEYAPLQYMNIRHPRLADVSEAQLEDYCEQVRAAVGTDYFTIHSLRQSGFTHPLDELGFDEWFYASLLAEDREHVLCRRVGQNKLFRYESERLRLVDFLEWLLHLRETLFMDLSALMTLLETEYRIFVDRSKIVEVVKGSAMYYDRITKKVYANYDVYLEEEKMR